MSVPLKSKLAHAWGRMKHKNQIYSHVFETRERCTARAAFDTLTTAQLSGTHAYDEILRVWLRAAEISKGSFNLYLCSSFGYSKPVVGGTSPFYKEEALETVSQKDAVEMIADWEDKLLNKEGFSLLERQPFKASIKTQLKL